jgi:NTE family protein
LATSITDNFTNLSDCGNIWGMSRALVLGGGGATGVAWLIGVLQGMAEGGVDTHEADLVIGTSAGSIVGARLADGQDFDVMAKDQIDNGSSLASAAMGGIDFMEFLKVAEAWGNITDNSPASLLPVTQMALQSKTLPEARMRELLDVDVAEHWPARAFRCSAVDAATGEFVVLDATSGVSLADAISASICVPGIFAPVLVGGRRLVDGGLYSGTCAELAAGHDSVLVIAPIGSRSDGMDPAAAAQIAREAAALEASGAKVTTLLPDDAANDVIGINRMDASISAAVMAEGHRQGKALAATLNW